MPRLSPVSRSRVGHLERSRKICILFSIQNSNSKLQSLHDLPPSADHRPRADRDPHSHPHPGAHRQIDVLGMALMPDPLLVVLLGPTATGKTSLSLALAEKFNGEIVSCDSVAVYRGFDIGTAKPSSEERARVPHHLLDVAEPSQPFTAGDYSKLARSVIAEIAARKRLPIVVGGTG